MTSRQLYDYLCQLIGSESTVKARRIYFQVKDIYRNVGNTPYTILNSGSKAEGLDMKGSDIDLMFINNSRAVYTDIAQCQERGHPELFLDTGGAPAGFAHIKVNFPLGTETKYIIEKGKKIEVDRTENGYILSNTSFKSFFCFIAPQKNIINCVFHSCSMIQQHGPCTSTHDGSLDLMFSYRLCTWPPVAFSWISRPRFSDWPPEDVISRIVHEQVLLVPIGSKFGSEDDNPLEWRISFSISEKILIHSLNQTQVLCYAMLKIILKEILDKNEHTKKLCSYFMKTLLFWTIEETGYSIWTPDNLLTCFHRCLQKLSYFLKYGILPNYFIPENNMIEGKITNNSLSELLAVIDLIYNDGIHFTQRTESLREFIISVTHEDILSQEFNSSDKKLELSKLHRTDVDLIPNSRDPVSSLIPIYSYILIFKSKLIRSLFSLMLLANFEDIRITKYNRCTGTNKILYRCFKTCTSYLLLEIKVVSWMRLALHFFHQKQYFRTLEILDFVREQNLTYKSLDKNIVNKCFLYNGTSYLKVFKLSSFCTHDERFPFFRLWMNTSAAPYLFNQFLYFLCYHQLHNFRDKRKALCTLVRLFEEYNDDCDVAATGLFVLIACYISNERLPRNIILKYFTSLLKMCPRQYELLMPMMIVENLTFMNEFLYTLYMKLFGPAMQSFCNFFLD